MFQVSAANPDQNIETIVVPVERLELAFAPRPWPFARERCDEIVAYFTALRRVNPALWNGRVLMLHEHAIRDTVFEGSYFETDFASMLAWRHWGFPDPHVKNCFAMGALRGNDGAFVLGVMAAHTANAGWIYFPAGIPEMSEETGLAAAEVEAQQGWTTVLAGARVAQIKILRAQETAGSLRGRILAH